MKYTLTQDCFVILFVCFLETDFNLCGTGTKNKTCHEDSSICLLGFLSHSQKQREAKPQSNQQIDVLESNIYQCSSLN